MFINAAISLTRPSGFSLEVAMAIKPRGVTALYGPSGSGKTTVLKLLAGLEDGSRGDQINISSDGNIWQDASHFVPPHKRHVGYVFQQPQLFPHLDVRGNLAYASKRAGSQPSAPLAQVCDWLGINHLLTASPAKLSGGEAQRVAIARVLLSGARCLLMDEPLGSVDHAARLQILPYLDRLRRLLDIPIVYVSHGLDEITYLADEVYMLEQGRIKAFGTVFELASSLTLNSQEGDVAAAVVEARVEHHDQAFGLTCLRLDSQSIYVSRCAQSPGTPIRLRIPARDVSLALQVPAQTSILNVLEGVISDIEPLSASPSLLVRVQVGGQYILSRITRKSLQQLELQPGKAVYVQIKTVALLSDLSQQVAISP
jgi:molybdate transport system ATP-binding protein